MMLAPSEAAAKPTLHRQRLVVRPSQLLHLGTSAARGAICATCELTVRVRLRVDLAFPYREQSPRFSA